MNVPFINPRNVLASFVVLVLLISSISSIYLSHRLSSNNDLSNIQNIQILQNGLRAGVYKMSNNEFMIGPQNIDNLKIIMRSIYLQYAEHYPNNITDQICRLNDLVLGYAVPAVYKEAIGYKNYVRDQSTIAMPMELPKQNDRDYKQNEFKQFM